MIRRATRAARAVPLLGTVTIGRGPGNQLVIPSREVSWHHAVVQRDGERVWIRDLGSRNGSRLDGQRIARTVAWAPGSVLAVGDVELSLRLGASPSTGAGPPLMVEDVASGLRYPLRAPRFVIGGPDADLALAGAGVVVVELVDGEPWLARAHDVRPIAEGEAFTVAGVMMRVVRAEDGWFPTKPDLDVERPGYHVEAAMDGESGAWARVTDPTTGLCHRVSAPNRVALLWFLAGAVQVDRDVPADDTGWRSNHAVAIAVWGKARKGHDPRLLKALIHNVRRELRRAGLDPWILEKRRGAVRLRATAVRLYPHA